MVQSFLKSRSKLKTFNTLNIYYYKQTYYYIQFIHYYEVLLKKMFYCSKGELMKILIDTFLIPLLDVTVNATWTFPTLISTTDGWLWRMGSGERGRERETQVTREKPQSCNIFIYNCTS